MGRKKNNKQPSKPARDESNLSKKELDGVVGGALVNNTYYKKSAQKTKAPQKQGTK